jgi:two-component system CheB/CheR fusion protein
VLENIIDNAIRYSTVNKPVVIRISKEGDMAVISITDRGVGISPENLPKLFKKFSRIEHPSTFQEEGAGLGLYWSKKVIALHGGKIEVRSVFGRGTTFRVVLPHSTKPGRAKRSNRNLVKRRDS